MAHEFEITLKEKFVQIISNGEKSFETSLKIWPRALKICHKNKCFKILGIANSSKPPTTIESYQHGALFHQFNIDHRHKIAWVELNPEAVESIQFLENVLFNRGFNVKLFQNLEEAKTWLLNEE